jgi:hypothetical protein
VFEEGAFKQILTANILPLISNKAPGAGTSTVANGGNGSSGQPAPGGAPGTGTGVTPPGAILPQPNQQQNARDFRDALTAQAQAQNVNLTPAQIDGIVANAYRESSMNPQVNNGQGLLQWSDPSRNAAANAYMQSNYGTTLAQSTPAQQAAWTINELNTTEGKALTQLQGTTNATDAANVFVQKYERSANQPGDQVKNQRYLPNLYGPGQGA